MAFKLLTKISMLAGLQSSGTSDKSDETLELNGSTAQNLTDSIQTSGDKLKALVLPPFGKCSFSKHQYYNVAVNRGLYFAHRMPDWATEFKKQTTGILDMETPSSLALKRYPYKKDHSTEDSFLYRNFRFEDSALDYFSERECLAQSAQDKGKVHQSVKRPKIKDDITCRKQKFD